MSSYYDLCFNRIDLVVISSYVEVPWLDIVLFVLFALWYWMPMEEKETFGESFKISFNIAVILFELAFLFYMF